MNQDLHNKIWPILRRGFSEVQELVAQKIPLLQGGASFWNNPTVPMFAYSSCSYGTTVIVLSFGVEYLSGQMHVIGDIASEEVQVLDEIIEVNVDTVEQAAECANAFIAGCKAKAHVLAEELLSRASGKNEDDGKLCDGKTAE
jgi:hypothetical protein